MLPDQEIKNAVEALKQGKVILYPTDTIWGIGCDATNAEAVKKVFEIKGRDEGKALIVLIKQVEQLHDYVVKVPEIAWDIVDFAERPLTVIYPKGKRLAENLLAEDGSVGIRIAKEPFCQELLKKFGKALVSTSANFSGMTSPVSFSDIDPKLIEKVDYVVDYKRAEKMSATPSMLMKLGIDGEIKILRK